MGKDTIPGLNRYFKGGSLEKGRRKIPRRKSRFKKAPNTKLMVNTFKIRGIKKEVIPNLPPCIPPHESEY